MGEEQNASGETPARTSLKFHYIKSSQFRVVHADGAYGGVTPRGYIHATFYSERRPLPQLTEVNLVPGDQFGAETPLAMKEDMVRELEVGVMLDLSSAKALHAWLEDKIKTVEMAFGINQDAT